MIRSSSVWSRLVRASCFAWALLGMPAAAQVVINEYLTSNIRGHVDELGQRPDWIELFNAGAAPVNLAGYTISDDPADPDRWTFPALWIEPAGHLLVYADGRDQTEVPAYWQTVIGQGTVGRYRANSSPIPAGWQQPGFDDSGWAAGPTGIGYGDGDDATTVPPVVSICVRIAFTVEDLANVSLVYLHMDYDDGFSMWLNGAEVWTQGLSASAPAWDALATSAHEAAVYRGGAPVQARFWPSRLVQGTNVLTVQVHTAEPELDDLSCQPFLTLGLRNEPSGGAVDPPPLLYAILPRPHTNFSLAADGETLVLADAHGVPLDTQNTGAMFADVSRGRAPDGSGQWEFYTSPTPGAANGANGAATFAAAPTFSVPGGAHAGPVAVSIAAPEPGTTVRYTLDGSVPGPDSPAAAGPITVAVTGALRAVSFRDGALPSRPASRTYIIDDPSTLPVVAFTAAPHDLWDPEDGMMVESNLFADIEIPVHVEYFLPDGTQPIDQDAGCELFGAYSRRLPQKSLELKARVAYGDADFSHRFFADTPIDEFVNVVWRNAGNDYCNLHLRDAFAHRLVADLDLESLAYQPCRAYVDGQYWGILNLREHRDAEYLASHTGFGPGEVDIIVNYWEVSEGTSDAFWTMYQYLSDHDLADQGHYDVVAAQMDVDNFATYQIVETFLANPDWLANNIAWWRPQVPGGRWRWLLYDVDAGLGLQAAVGVNMLSIALDDAGSGPGSPAFHTQILRSLMNNAGFRARFINRYCDLLNTVFNPSRSVPLAEATAATLAPEIGRHLQRWNGDPAWSTRLLGLYDFLQQRPLHAREHLRQRFALGPDVTVSVAVEPVGGGQVQLTAARVDSSYAGVYFAGHPMTLAAEPAWGWAFAGWSDGSLGGADSVTVVPTADYAVTARFVPAVAGEVVINEINYNAPASADPADWVELHNSGGTPLDLSGWVFRDGDDAHRFALPAGTVLPAGGYLVLCEDRAGFGRIHPGVDAVLGDLGFGFSGSGEALRLFRPDGVLHDQVTYDDGPPWPAAPDGQGPTLELIAPYLDNALPASWRASTSAGGTPGAPNSAAVAVGDASPLPFSLAPASPNPFNPRTRLRFALDRAGPVTLVVHDLRGARVQQLVAAEYPAGRHEVVWDGTDDAGRPVASGIYMARLVQAERTAMTKLLLVR